MSADRRTEKEGCVHRTPLLSLWEGRPVLHSWTKLEGAMPREINRSQILRCAIRVSQTLRNRVEC